MRRRKGRREWRGKKHMWGWRWFCGHYFMFLFLVYVCFLLFLSLFIFFVSVFVHRFRDVDPSVRALSGQKLGQWMLHYPHLFLQDSYLKYLGWMLNDRDTTVRQAALVSILHLHENPTEVQLAKMGQLGKHDRASDTPYIANSCPLVASISDTHLSLYTLLLVVIFYVYQSYSILVSWSASRRCVAMLIQKYQLQLFNSWHTFWS